MNTRRDGLHEGTVQTVRRTVRTERTVSRRGTVQTVRTALRERGNVQSPPPSERNAEIETVRRTVLYGGSDGTGGHGALTLRCAPAGPPSWPPASRLTTGQQRSGRGIVGALLDQAGRENEAFLEGSPMIPVARRR
jgi:hypothetical protein